MTYDETNAPTATGAGGPPLTYSTYLKIRELISVQLPLSDPPVHDEMLFIVIHQTYELWFKQTLFELDALVEHLNADRLPAGLRVLDRVHEIFRLLVQQIDVLETMTPVEFHRFREILKGASGFQSCQFRELEILVGANPRQFETLFDLEPEWKSRLAARASRQTIRDALFPLLCRRGLLAGDDPDAVRAALLRVYREEPEHFLVHNLCEHLIRFDEQISLWRFRHMQMAERMIGMRSGTGASEGVSYLKNTLATHFFPELWEVRSSLHCAGDAP